MKKSDQNKIKNQLMLILLIIAGFVGTNVLLAKAKEYLPVQFQKFSNIAGLAASIWGAAMSKQGWIKDVSLGGAAFSAINLVNQFIPDSFKQYVPQLSGLGVTNTSLGDVIPSTLKLPAANPTYDYSELNIDDTFAGINGGSLAVHPTEEMFT